LQSCNKPTAGLLLDKMRCTVERKFRIPTGPMFWLTTLDYLVRVGGVPTQSIKSVALSLHCQYRLVYEVLGSQNTSSVVAGRLSGVLQVHGSALKMKGVHR